MGDEYALKFITHYPSQYRMMTIAYHIANKNIAEDLKANLGSIGYDFREAICGENSQTLAPQLRETTGKVLLIISDNFLKSEQSMYELLEVFQEMIRSERVLPLITDGRYRDSATGIYIQKPTSFDRVSDAIQYMNYWQDEYLEVRRKKRELANSENATESSEEELNNKLAVIRNISSDIGEFFRFLRSKKHLNYPDFRADNFAAFFEFVGDNAPENFASAAMPAENWETSAETVEENIDSSTEITEEVIESPNEEVIVGTAAKEDETPIEIADIPGMDLLIDLEETAVEEEETLNFLQEEEVEEEVVEPAKATAEETATAEVEEMVEEVAELESSAEEEEMMDALDRMFDGEGEEAAATVESEEASEVEALGPEVQEEIPSETVEEEILPENSADAALHNIHLILSEDDVHAAMEQYQSALEAFPENVHLRYGYATSLIKYNKDFNGARTQLKRLVEYDTENYNAHFLLGEIAEINEDYEDAKTHFEQVLALNPEHVDAPYRLANILSNYFEGQEAQASALFATAIERKPDNADAHYQYAVLQDEYFEDDELALKHYQEAIALDAEHPYAHYDLAVLYHALEDMDNAKAAYVTASAINPEVKTPQNDAAFLGTPLEYQLPPEGIIRDDVYEEGQNLIVEEEVQDEAPVEAEVEAMLEEEIVLGAVEPEMKVATPVEEEQVVADKAEVAALQADIKRLEDLVLKNQNMLMLAQQNLSERQEETPVPTQPRVDKVVVITGATSGIGRATADVFAAAGYRLILTGRRGERLEALQMEYQDKYDSDVLTQTFDVRDLASVQAMVDSLDDNWRKVDILINNAGLAKGFAPIHEGEIEDWETMIDTNVKGLLYMTRAISPYMVARGEGHIINVCSSAGHEPYANGNVYCATKYAVDALTKTMRLDLHKHHIRVSQVSPGHVEETEFALTRFDGDVERAKIYEDFQPLKSSDVAETIFFLATRPKHVNIQDVRIFGTQQASATVVDRSGR